MDNHTQSSGLNTFSEADRKEIGQFLEQESQKAKFQESMSAIGKRILEPVQANSCNMQ